MCKSPVSTVHFGNGKKKELNHMDTLIIIEFWVKLYKQNIIEELLRISNKL